MLLFLHFILYIVLAYNENEKKGPKISRLWEIFGETYQEVGKEFFDKNQDLDSLNIPIIGRAGVGKSRLVNTLFNGSFAEESKGRPVTQMIYEYKHARYPLTIYDTPGLELKGDKQKKLFQDLSNLIIEHYETKDPTKFIHCIWYCIQCGSSRIEELEIDFIKKIRETYSCEIPVIIVLTQCYSKEDTKEMIEALEKENLGIPIVPIVAIKKKFGSFIIKSFGLDTLVLVMKDSFSDILFKATINNKTISIKGSKRSSYYTIGIYSTIASGVGYIPIPFGKITSLTLINILMIKKIANKYGIPVLGETLTEIFNNTFKECFFMGPMSNEKIEIPKEIIELLTKFNTGGFGSAVAAGSTTAMIGLSYSLIAEFRCKSAKDPNSISYDDMKMKINDLFNYKWNEDEKTIFRKINAIQ